MPLKAGTAQLWPDPARKTGGSVQLRCAKPPEGAHKPSGNGCPVSFTKAI